MKMLHPCKCKSYNGGQCYNCLNGAHDLCTGGCKTKRSKQVGVIIIVTKRKKKKGRCACGNIINSKKCLEAHFNPMNQSAHINPFRY